MARLKRKGYSVQFTTRLMLCLTTNLDWTMLTRLRSLHVMYAIIIVTVYPSILAHYIIFLSQRDAFRPRTDPLISPLFQVTTKSCSLDTRSIIFFYLLDQPRPQVPGAYPSIYHGIISRLRPQSLILSMFKIMYVDGMVSQPKNHSFRQSDSFNKSFRLIHDRLLAPVP